MIRLARAHYDRLNSGKICIQSGRLINISIKLFVWSSKSRTGFTFSRAKEYWHLDVMQNCCHDHMEIDLTPLDDFFITIIDIILAVCWVTSQLVVQGSL